MKLFQKTKDRQSLNLAAENYGAAAYVQSMRSANMENESSRIEFDKTTAVIALKKKTADSLIFIYTPK